MTIAPWMPEADLRVLLRVLAQARPKRIVEWGSGGSTSLFSKVPDVELIVSIEHDEGWAEKVRQEVFDERLRLLHVPADVRADNEGPGSEWAKRAERDASILKTYVAAADELGPFDFAFVDGRARRYCLRAGYRLLRAGGTMLLHDSRRPEYQDVLVGELRGRLVPGTQMAIVRKLPTLMRPRRRKRK